MFFLWRKVKNRILLQTLFIERHCIFLFLPPDGATAADSIYQCCSGAGPANSGHQISHSGNRDRGYVPQSILRQGSDSSSEKSRYTCLHYYTLLVHYVILLILQILRITNIPKFSYFNIKFCNLVLVRLGKIYRQGNE